MLSISSNLAKSSTSLHFSSESYNIRGSDSCARGFQPSTESSSSASGNSTTDVSSPANEVYEHQASEVKEAKELVMRGQNIESPDYRGTMDTKSKTLFLLSLDENRGRCNTATQTCNQKLPTYWSNLEPRELF